MNAALWMAWSLLPLMPGQSSAEPYAAVIVESTEARCGPGTRYYATSRLGAGDRVEVYRREAGWLGVRPPRGSFSWAPARQLKTTEIDDVAVAAEDNVRVWIGTSLTQLNKHHWQVELRKGEAVEIWGEKQLITPAGSVADTWYKISPPAGEFRWVPQSAVRRDDGSEGDSGQGQPLAIPAAPKLTEPPQFERISDQPLTLPPAGAAAPLKTTKPVRPAPKPEWLSWQPPADPAQFERLLEQFNTDLAAIAAQRADQWQLDELRIKAGKMAEQGPSALQRGKARKLLANVEEFRKLAARMHGDVSADAVADAATGSSPASGTASFAGEGWLMPVHSKNKSVPPYVVVDDQGRFLKFVSPDGINLRPYEKKKVGLIGPSSYIPSLDMPHVTAQRVVRLR